MSIPEIPQGQQIAGAGTQENNSPASPIAPNAQPPQNPIQAELGAQQQHAQVQPPAPTEPPAAPPAAPPAEPESTSQFPEDGAPERTEPPKVEAGSDFVETSINYMTAELGVSPDAFDAVYENAIKHNDLSLINPAALGTDLTEAQAAQIKQLATAAVQKHQSAVESAKSTIYSVAGGETEWKTAVQAFNSNAPADVMEYAKYLSDTGKIKQAAEYVLKYNTQQGLVNSQKQPPIQGGTGTVTNGMSKAEYTTELAKLEQEAGNRSLGSPAYAARLNDLNSRRALGRQQGL